MQLIDAAQERFDAVVVAVGAVSDPTTQTLLYDVDQTVMCIRPGTSTESAVEEMYRDLVVAWGERPWRDPDRP